MIQTLLHERLNSSMFSFIGDWFGLMLDLAVFLRRLRASAWLPAWV